MDKLIHIQILKDYKLLTRFSLSSFVLRFWANWNNSKFNIFLSEGEAPRGLACEDIEAEHTLVVVYPEIVEFIVERAKWGVAVAS